ncbi:MAG: glycosyltransferase family 4 protein [Candidatus Eisenbacteria bacterium]|nr:glycosyltransferase family 4 protein [Candidatus Eisenbacteria bacterium]
MRIALISPSADPIVGGVSEQVHGLAESLAARGQRVTIVTGGVSAAAAPSRSLPPGVALERIGRTWFLPINGGRTALAHAPRLEATLRERIGGRFDLVHVHAPYEWGLALSAVSALDEPLVGTFHASGHLGWPWTWFAAYARPRLARLAARIAVSVEAERWACTLFAGTYRVIPNAIDVARFAPDRRRGGVGSRLRLLVVGRLEPRKGLEPLFEALMLLDRTRFELHLVGDGPCRTRLERLARSARLPVRFHGRLAPAELPAAYAASDLVLAPAVHGESFGVVLLEAMAAGRPLFASDIPGYRAVVGAAGAARLLPPGDPGAWSAAIAELLPAAGTRALLPALTEAGERCVRAYDWARITPRIEAVYEEVLGKSGGEPKLPRQTEGSGRTADQRVASARAEMTTSLSRSLLS